MYRKNRRMKELLQIAIKSLLIGIPLGLGIGYIVAYFIK